MTVLDEEKKVHIREFNQIDNKDLDKLCMNEYYEPQFSILPRTRPLRYKRPFEKVTRKWGIPISLFKDWKVDHEELHKKCFEFDWSNNKLYKFIKNDAERD